MLWKTLIVKITLFAYQNSVHQGARTLRTRARYSGKVVSEYVEQYDVHAIAQLRELVPEAFPRKLRKGTLVASQNIHGAWRIDAPPLPEQP